MGLILLIREIDIRSRGKRMSAENTNEVHFFTSSISFPQQQRGLTLPVQVEGAPFVT